jgi:cAMP-dependent protein kinase regulator
MVTPLQGCRVIESDLANLPFLRDISKDAVSALAASINRREIGPAMDIVNEGDAADSLYFLVAGQARAMRRDSPKPLGVLDAPTVFGEMALVAATPRLASVASTTRCVILEVQRDAVYEAASRDTRLTEMLLGFHHDRLWKNVLAVSPIFAPLGEERMRRLATEFITVNVPPGTTLLTEGQPGTGLFILLRGSCEVVRGSSVIARLSEGDLFGEISLALFDRPCSATVRAATDAVVLQLSREAFQRLIMSDPETRSRVMTLALRRLNEIGGGGDTRKPAIY